MARSSVPGIPSTCERTANATVLSEVILVRDISDTLPLRLIRSADPVLSVFR